MVSETLDGALEWMENKILEAHGVSRGEEENLMEISDFDLFREFDAPMLVLLSSCMVERSLKPGDKVIAHGDSGDELFLIRRGSVKILLPLEGGKFHHIATIGRGDFFGELSFFDKGSRSADVEAKVHTDLFILSRKRFNEATRTDPIIGVRVFARLASTIALRLRMTDAELRIVEDR